MVVYFDTSALVKLYIAEPDSDQVSELWGRASVATSSELLYVEMASAFARSLREQRAPASALMDAQRQFFDVEWAGFHRIPVGTEILLSARDLLMRHALRASDAVHLASALQLRDLVPDDDLIIACADGALATAARSDGFKVGP